MNKSHCKDCSKLKEHLARFKANSDLKLIMSILVN